MAQFVMKKIDSPIVEIFNDLITKHPPHIVFGNINLSRLIWDFPNEKFEKLVQDWFIYLKQNGVCPKCKKDLNTPNKCNCGWAG